MPIELEIKIKGLNKNTITQKMYTEKDVQQIKWECDLAIQQLKGDYGVGLGKPKSPDVVKVVRCMDCKYSRNLQTISEKAMYRTGCVICTNGEISNTEFAMWGNDFCSYGERKDEREENESR